MKKCTCCKTIKNIQNFHKWKLGKDGYKNECKICSDNRLDTYFKTKNGWITQSYNSMIQRIKRKSMQKIKMTKSEFKSFIESNNTFNILYENWKKSNYNKDLKPSVDRLEDYATYSINNIQIITWKENNEKGNIDRRHGINNKVSKKIIQLTLSKQYVMEYHSIHYASRQTGINRGNIGNVCRGIKNTAGGFIWRFKQ